MLPERWMPDGNSDRLIEKVVLEAKQLNYSSDRRSLAQVTRFKSSTALVPQDRFDLHWVKPFLALPRVRTFRGPSFVAIGDDGDTSIAPGILDRGFGNSLVVVDFLACCINDVSIARFLQNTPRLRMLRYSHMAKTISSSHDWDICRFFKAIEREVENFLEELSISICEVHGSIASSKASTSGFQRLRKLELPLELAECHIAASTAPPTVPTADNNPLVVDSSLNKDPSISDFVPDSIIIYSTCMPFFTILQSIVNLLLQFLYSLHPIYSLAISSVYFIGWLVQWSIWMHCEISGIGFEDAGKGETCWQVNIDHRKDGMIPLRSSEGVVNGRAALGAVVIALYGVYAVLAGMAMLRNHRGGRSMAMK
ncbi:MAG: hypothetical protein Q9228_001261 [Teloschistes exilis]